MNYSEEQIKTELLKYKLPWISKFMKKIGYPFLRFTIIPTFIGMMIMGGIYNNSEYGQNEWIWILLKTVAIFFIFVIGGLAIIAHLVEKKSVNKLRRKLCISHMELKYYIEKYQITGM